MTISSWDTHKKKSKRGDDFRLFLNFTHLGSCEVKLNSVLEGALNL